MNIIPMALTNETFDTTDSALNFKTRQTSSPIVKSSSSLWDAFDDFESAHRPWRSPKIGRWPSQTSPVRAILHLTLLILCLFSVQTSALVISDRAKAAGVLPKHSDLLVDDSLSATAQDPFDMTRDTSLTASFKKLIPEVIHKRQSGSVAPGNAPLPRPFDTSLGNNFTASSCPLFFTSFLNDPKLQACHPVSLMLSTSSSFFQATKHATQLTRVLDASCSIEVDSCDSIMASYAQQLRADGGCGADFKLNNPAVIEAYDGFVGYRAVQQATCRKAAAKEDGAGKYCYVNAVTNVSSPTSNYIYYLPVGVGLPAGAMPACNRCLEDTMNGFASFASNETQPVSAVYPQAAQQINLNCGPKYVNSTVQSTSGAAAGHAPPSLTLLSLPLLLLFFT